MTPSAPASIARQAVGSSPLRSANDALRSAQQRVHAFGIAARFLQRDDARMAGELRDGLRQQVAAGAAGHVVEDDRQPAVVGDRAVVRDAGPPASGARRAA